MSWLHKSRDNSRFLSFVAASKGEERSRAGDKKKRSIEDEVDRRQTTVIWQYNVPQQSWQGFVRFDQKLFSHILLVISVILTCWP